MLSDPIELYTKKKCNCSACHAERRFSGAKHLRVGIKDPSFAEERSQSDMSGQLRKVLQYISSLTGGIQFDPAVVYLFLEEIDL